VLDTLRHPRIHQIVNHVEGLISWRTAVLLYRAVTSNRNHTGDIIEIGAYKGLSTCVLSLAAKKVGKRVKSFELFTGLPSADPHLDKGFQQGMFSASVDEFERNLKTYGCRNCVDLIIGDARDTLKTNGNSGFSVAFVDTDVYEVTKDVLLQLSSMAKGGEIIVIHDCFASGVAKAIEELRNRSNFKLLMEKIEEDDLTAQYRLIHR